MEGRRAILRPYSTPQPDVNLSKNVTTCNAFPPNPQEVLHALKPVLLAAKPDIYLLSITTSMKCLVSPEFDPFGPTTFGK